MPSEFGWDMQAAVEDFRDARFVEADFNGAQFRGVVFSNVTVTDAWLKNVELSGLVDGLSVNGIDVTEYVDRRLDELHPEREILAPTDPDGMRTTWRAVEHFSAATLERARQLPPDRLNESVGRVDIPPDDPPLVFATVRAC